MIPITFLLFLTFRNLSIENAKDKAFIVAKLARDGLTTYMEHGMMQKRGDFLAKIKNIPGVENLRILRSPLVDKQFGKSFESHQRLTPIEKRVFQTAKEQDSLTETLSSAHLKIAIPYIASAYNRPNCLKCHHAKEGDVLGAVSMDFNISSLRQYTLSTILELLLIILVVTLIALLFLDKQIERYISFFENIKTVIKRAFEGDYSQRMAQSNEKEIEEISYWVNSLMDKIESSLKKMSDSVRSFIRYSGEQRDPLKLISDLVEELAYIYRFKDIIEKEKEIELIYQDIGELLSKKFGLEHFCIYEVHKKSSTRESVYEKNYDPICPSADSNIELCRALNHKQIVYSEPFIDVCKTVENREWSYICIPIEINDNLSILLSILCKDPKAFKQLRVKASLIQNYLEIARPTMMTTLLMEEFKKQSLIDTMTGAYNRRYMELIVEKSLKQALRLNIPYSILMLDIDHFKEVNDRYGHDAGDEVIKAMVDTIKRSIRESDTLIRFGGEEFLLFLYNCNKQQAKRVAEKIRIEFENLQIDIGGRSIQKSVSIGVSEFPLDGADIWRVIKAADLALYQAKKGGRNRVEIYKPEPLEQE